MEPKPTTPCYICKKTDYWWTQKTGWLCAYCHPCTDPEALAFNNELQLKEERQTLLQRCRTGMQKLNETLEAIQAIDTDGNPVAKQKVSEAMDKWKAGVSKLDVLVMELKERHDFQHCLFFDDVPAHDEEMTFCEKKQDKHLCWACPKDWAKELFGTQEEQPQPKTQPREIVDLFGKKPTNQMKMKMN